MFQNPFNENNLGQPFNPLFPPQFGGPMIPPPFGVPDGPGAPTQMPGGPPPNFSPMMSGSQSGSNGINRCIYRNTFIWLHNGDSFWFFPTFISRNVLLGFRWGRFGWTFSSVNRDSILTFQCF